MIQHEGGSINLPTEYENSATMDYNNSVAAELLDSSNDSLNQLFSTDANFPNLELYTTSFSQSLPPVDVLQACVNLFQKSYSIRIPFIHQQTIVSPFLNLEIKYAMAAIGARGNPEYAPFSKIFFREACSYLHGTTSKNQLSRLQCQVLLIDFAVWTSDDTLHEWATQEVHKTAMVVKSLMGVDLYDGCKSEWTNWIDDEEHTRTIFAFYCLSISISIIYDYGNILSFHSIDLNLPEQEATWRACTEVEWYQEKQKQTGGDIHRAKFQSSIHALLTCDVSCEERYESASVFGRRVLLCAIAEAFDMAKRLPMNFLSEEGYHRASMSDFRLRTNFLEALKIWKNLWWAKPECLWDPTSSALAQLENMTFLNCLLIALSPSRTDELSNSREGITAAIEIFCSISKCGYLDETRLSDMPRES
ncbi:Zinc finger C2H2-type protein [Penicillium vulpinum]|uniref:Zinc finger C2H2-type protein n=1 Tax=Penicillium vulpinum TaxID=29845 RepID=UPI002547A2B1|nr:Zinc finger C2H2-type protein [Penicillium vulpinum]KAJ5970737.1 Zinc finger C2H2-type protein [Penicillium vulpinum]